MKRTRGLAILLLLTFLSFLVWDLIQTGVLPNPVEAIRELSVTLDQSLRGGVP